MMRKIMMIGVMLVLALNTAACTRIGAGYVGIKVSMAGDNRGVDQIPTTTGWVFYNPMTQTVYEWPTFMKQTNLEGTDAISFSSESMVITAPLGFSYTLEASKVPHFFVKFRTDDLDGFTHGFLKNLIRDKMNEVASGMTIDQITNDQKGFLTKVKDEVQKAVAPYGVHMEDQFGFTGKIELPPQVTAAVNAKIKATQDAMAAENQLRQTRAEMEKERIKNETYAANKIKYAEAEAEANLKVARSLTPELVEWKKLDKWNGQLPQVTGSGGGVLLSLGK